MTAPFRIGIVCFPSLGGSGVVATELAVGLAERGHSVHVISRSQPGRPLPPCPRLTFHKVQVAEYPLFDYPPYTVALTSALIDLTREHSLDIVNVHYAVPHAVSAYVAKQALAPHAPRMVTSLHGTDVLRVGTHPAYRSATRFTVAQSDGILVPSAFLQQEAYRQLGVPETLAIEVIPNFVDTDRFAPAVTRNPHLLDDLFDGANLGPVLFHVSNFRPVKRVVDVIEVLARVRKELPARAILVGEGPERARAEERVRQLGLEPHVRFLGRRTDFIELLQQADAFLLPSEMESFGVAALESLSSGVPVFGYRVGGLPELVTPEVGRLVEPLDVDGLAKALLQVLSHAPTHDALRLAARERAVSGFRAGPALDRYERYLQQRLESDTGRSNG